MIKSTHSEFEKLISGSSVNSTPELQGFLDGIGVPYTRLDSVLTLNPGMELLDEAAIRAELQHLVSESQLSTLDVEIHRVAQSTNDVVMQRLVILLSCILMHLTLKPLPLELLDMRRIVLPLSFRRLLELILIFPTQAEAVVHT